MRWFKHHDGSLEATPEPASAIEVETAEPAAPAVTTAFGRFDERWEDGELVIQVELPGIDPDKDLELAVADGLLHIEAHHREDTTTEEGGYVWREIRHGSFVRTLPLPAGVSEADVKATYKDGNLAVRVPAPAPQPTTKVPVTTS
jgi:HSP20 family protein